VPMAACPVISSCQVPTQVAYRSCLLLAIYACGSRFSTRLCVNDIEHVSILAAATQQLGGSASGMYTSFGNQPAEDPALFVTFEEEDDDFPSSNRAAVARSQPMPARTQAVQPSVGAQAANSRQQPPAGNMSSVPSRAPSAGPVKTLSAAEQELEDLKRRIAEKERQMKAKRQTGQGYSGMPVRSRPNPAHGPILRGLHRKQPAVEEASQSTREADLFLKQVAAELPPSGKGETAVYAHC